MTGDGQSILDLINKRFDSIEKSLVEKVSAEVAGNVCEKISSSVDSKITEALEPIVSNQEEFQAKTEAHISNHETKVSKLNSLLIQSSAGTSPPPLLPVQRHLLR